MRQRWVPTFHRFFTHDFAKGLQRRPDHRVHAVTWGPISIIWDRSFKKAEAKRASR